LDRKKENKHDRLGSRVNSRSAGSTRVTLDTLLEQELTEGGVDAVVGAGWRERAITEKEEFQT